MANILDRIVAVKHQEVEALRSTVDEGDLAEQIARSGPRRPFLRALLEAPGFGLIAEVKKASPSKGVIRPDFDPVWTAKRYAAGGANCLSILTDEQFFQGSLDYLRSVRAAVSLPVLRKDFIIDSLQLREARAAGADCVLLIAACLAPSHLRELHEEANLLGMDVLVEVHDREEWEGVLSSGLRPPMVGVNNRNLKTFEVSLSTTEELAAGILAEAELLVAESGIFTAADVTRLGACGARAVLVGESLMREADPGAAAAKLRS